MGLIEEKAAAFGGADSYVMEQAPGGKVEEHRPDMPQDIFTEFNKIDQMFLEASGLTELVSGKGETGVRSGSHARQLKQTGSGRIKKVAERMKPALVKVGDLGLKLKIMHDDERIIPAEDEHGKKEPFLPAEIQGDLKMRVDGHEYSPLFADEAEAKVMLLSKIKAIRRQMAIRLIRPPAMDNLLHDAQKMDKEERAEAQLKLQQGGQQPHRGRKK